MVVFRFPATVALRQTDKQVHMWPTSCHYMLDNVELNNQRCHTMMVHDVQNPSDFLVSYREFGPLLHDFVPQHSGGDGPLLSLLGPSRIRDGAGAAGVLHRGLQSSVDPGPCHRALEGRWCPAAAASVQTAGLTLGTQSSTSSAVVLGAAGDAA